MTPAGTRIRYAAGPSGHGAAVVYEGVVVEPHPTWLLVWNDRGKWHHVPVGCVIHDGEGR